MLDFRPKGLDTDAHSRLCVVATAMALMCDFYARELA